MYSFEFNHLESLTGINQLEDGFYLWVFHADKIPPHIGCSVNGKYFSLKFNGKDENVPIELVLATIDRKSIPTLVIEIKSTVSLEMVMVIFESYSTTVPDEVTCLAPISRLLHCPDSVMKLSNLLSYLALRAELLRVFKLHLGHDFIGIKHYSQGDIHKTLKQLRDAKS
jgi:hypothetical protein